MILTDEELLRRPCTDATMDEAVEIIKLLEEELKKSAEHGRAGIGLAAPQIGITKKVAIVRYTNGKKSYNVNLVNCYIDKGYDLTYFDGEGCLSFPDKFVRTMRYQEIVVKGNLVEPKSFIATSLPSVIIQHEMNHWEGKLLPDLGVK
jgi:peptide deformylase